MMYLLSIEKGDHEALLSKDFSLYMCIGGLSSRVEDLSHRSERMGLHGMFSSSSARNW